jgi:hypothetical protein
MLRLAVALALCALGAVPAAAQDKPRTGGEPASSARRALPQAVTRRRSGGAQALRA